MATPVLPDAQAQAALDALTQYGTEVKAAEVLKIPRSTFASRVVEARRRGMIPSPHIEDLNNVDHLRARLKRLESELQHAQQHVLNHEIIKQRIIQLGHNVAEIGTPSWILNAPTDHDLPGVPTLFVSDLHWAEVVHPSQINGVNKYNITIARQRMERLALSTVRLLSILSPTMQYPGIVIPLGGDMITGNIHDELTATNEMNSMPAILDLFEVLGIFLSSMADKFGKVFVPCVTGNHGRDTRKIWAKDRHHTSFDWLLYCFLAKHFAQDSRITFLIPDGPDAYFKIYSHRYLMTHGDQFRGGDGMIGALGPIIRGDHKKRSRNAQIDMEYDTMIIGHWHQYIHLTRLIVNGSLKGYDEFAYANNFPFEKPQQALWLTHPKYGITYRMPVFVDRLRKPSKTAWVSVAA